MVDELPEVPTAAVDADVKTTSSQSSPSSGAVPPPPVSPVGTIRAEASDPPATQPSTAERAFQQGLKRENLEQEVGQVLGTLNSWWGGVKKQSVSAITSIKADLDKTVSQAQADLEYLRTAKVEVVRKDPAEFEAEQEAERVKKATKKEEEARTKEKGKEKEDTSTSIIDRLTSSTAQLQHSLQATLQSTLASASTTATPAALRAQLAENLRLSSARENLQLSMKQAEKLAEDYLRKSDHWMKEAEKWVEDAVKLVPPTGGEVSGTSWDGEWYSFSTSTRSSQPSESLFDVRSERPSLNTLAQAGSRKDALLRRLREDKDLLLVDPEGDDETTERTAEFRAWVTDHWEKDKIVGREQEAGEVGAIRMSLVPEHISDDQFWQRYLFHKHNIEAEEQKRKQLLQSTQHQEHDDFKWDDEEDSTSPAGKPEVATNSTPKVDTDGKLPAVQQPQPSAAKAASTATSPRDSEESYDLVSDQGIKAEKPTRTASTTAATEGDSDSDWE